MPEDEQYYYFRSPYLLHNESPKTMASGRLGLESSLAGLHAGGDVLPSSGASRRVGGHRKYHRLHVHAVFLHSLALPVKDDHHGSFLVVRLLGVFLSTSVRGVHPYRATAGHRGVKQRFLHRLVPVARPLRAPTGAALGAGT
uniref:Uncharacterized protein n=1 Tax=Timema cristinae TaxID=61476 RepID=A0A7R9GTL3_TIMCR|nr:unnamed protein product [Timema cristinae]